eukprot:4773923-Pleurochrysis_carterae.AAC.4
MKVESRHCKLRRAAMPSEPWPTEAMGCSVARIQHEIKRTPYRTKKPNRRCKGESKQIRLQLRDHRASRGCNQCRPNLIPVSKAHNRVCN